MFEHSVKVPRHFKLASNIVKKVSTEGGSVKTLLYDNKLRHFRTNVIYALVTETIKHAADIDKIFESCNLLTKEPRLDPWLAKILTAELLFGKKILPGKSKPEQTILSYKKQFEQFATENPDALKTEVIRRPRYVRINTSVFTTSDAIRAFQDEGFKFIRCTSGSYDDYRKQVQGLTEYDFIQDYHVKTMFVFSAGTKWHDHDLYLEKKIILQDKATAMAVHLMSPPAGSTVMDMCAAPGMKTTQLAAFMRNQGKIYAVERNKERYETLCEFVKSTESKCVETINKDVLEIRRGDYDDVEYILLDPSCSGSGMDLSVHNYIDATRLARLTSLQEKFLKHAMNAFPKAKRIVYSTCSVFPEENERVITNMVKASRSKWRVQDIKELLKGQWNNFGSNMYGSMGARCMYARQDSDLTTGFFVAVLDRDQESVEKSLHKDESESKTVEIDNSDLNSEENAVSDIKKAKMNRKAAEVVEVPQEVEVSKIKKSKKKDKINDPSTSMEKVENTDNTLEGAVNTSEPNEVPKKKKKSKIKDLDESVLICEVTRDDSERVKKHKKRKKDAEIPHVEDELDHSEGAPKKKKKNKL